MKVGLFFGSFNPIHVGHLIIANYMADYTDFDEVWLVVSPQSPHKKKQSLLDDYHRLSLVKIAVEDNQKLRACDIEFGLSKPSYTATTLAYLKEKHPNYSFSLIMGEDNLRTLHKWHNYEEIIANHRVYVYPRLYTQQELESAAPKIKLSEHKNVVNCKDVPLMKVSSSFIRKAIQEKKDVRYLLSEPVFNYVDEMNFYR